ncbi:hypothetical protein BH23PAT2_BH23PAT2_06290 [soil metagenome]
MEHSTKTTAITVAAIAVLAGGGIGYALGNNMEDSSTQQASTSAIEPTSDTGAADLRVLLNNLHTEHVELATTATRAGFDGDKNFEAAAASLGENTNQLAEAVTSVYGEEAGERFEEIWASHIGFFVDYTVAAKGGDQAGMDQAVSNLTGYVEAISDFYSSANENLPKEVVAQVVGDHVGLLKQAVDTYAAGDLEASYDFERQARVQIGGIADVVSGAIVKQNPDNF